MKPIALSVFVILALAACGPKETYRTSGPPREEPRAISCHYAGYCVTCGPVVSLEGISLKCGHIGFNAMCEGTQNAVVRITPITVYYEDGTHRITEKMETIQTLTTCS